MMCGGICLLLFISWLLGLHGHVLELCPCCRHCLGKPDETKVVKMSQVLPSYHHDRGQTQEEARLQQEHLQREQQRLQEEARLHEEEAQRLRVEEEARLQQEHLQRE